MDTLELTVEEPKLKITKSNKKVEVKQLLKPLFHNSITPKPILEESFKLYSAGWDKSGTRINTGLSFEEEKRFLPMILNISNKDNDFRQKVTDYYANISQRVNYDGLELDASYEEIDGQIYPVNIKDYLLSRMLQTDDSVKSNLRKDDVDEYLCKFELIDKSKQKQIDNEKFIAANNAMIEFVKLTNNDENSQTVKEILIYLHNDLQLNVIDIYNFDSLEAKQKLKELADKHPEKFVKVAKDSKINIKSLIRESISYGVISPIGDSYYYGEEKVGNTIKEITTYLSNNNDLMIKIKEIVLSRRKEYSK